MTIDKIPFLYLFGLSMLLSCNCGKEPEIVTEQDANGVYTKLPHLWSSFLHRGTLAVFSNIFEETGTVYNNAVLVPTTTSATTSDLTLMRVRDGSRIWSWQASDIYSPGVSSSVRRVYQHDSLLVGQVGRTGYCLNLANGTTRWIQDRSNSTRTNSFQTEVAGIGDKFFCVGTAQTQLAPKSQSVYAGYIGSVQTGEINELLLPHLSEAFLDSGLVAGFNSLIPSIGGNGDTLLSCTFGEGFSDWRPGAYLGLYNLTQKAWVYDRVEIMPPGLNSIPDWVKVQNGRVYAAVDRIMCCHDLMTGQQLWQTPLPGNLLFSGFAIVDDLFIANCEDTYMYGLDIATGQQRWKEKSSGTSSPLLALNGVVYFVGGGDGLFHAVEAATGKHLWKLKATDGSHFSPGPYVIPATKGEKPKVVARTKLYAYCYEAAR